MIKDTIYVDVDDEITGLIDKLQSSPHKIIALVLPKRASVLHSIINMKLLKRSAETAKKKIVLITSETGLMPLAGVVGVHVAKSLQSKPYLPKPPGTLAKENPEDSPPLSSGDSESSEGEGDDDNKAEESDAETTDGDELADDVAKIAAAPAAASAAEEDETIALDNSDAEEGKGDVKSKLKKGLHAGLVKVPNFERFRVSIILGGLAFVLLIFGWVFAFLVWPHASVKISTDSQAISTSVSFTANAATPKFDLAQKALPAAYEENKQTDSEKVSATGQKDVGTKASGTMTLTNCINDGESHTIAAGTGFNSGNFTFLTDTEITLDPALYSGSNCKSATFGLSKPVAVTAQKAGDSYNLAARSYTVPSSLSTADGSVIASGSDMSGGVRKITTVISQADIDSAKAKIKGRLDNNAKKALLSALNKDGVMPIDESFTISDPAVTASPALDAEAAQTTVTAVTTYGLMGVKKDDLSQLVKQDVDKQIDKKKQSILDDGVSSGIFRVDNRLTPSSAGLTLSVIATAGPQLDAKQIANDIKGKKKGEATQLILQRPGITDVKISYSPFWVWSTPKSADKITVTFEKPKVTKSNSKPTNAVNP